MFTSDIIESFYPSPFRATIHSLTTFANPGADQLKNKHEGETGRGLSFLEPNYKSLGNSHPRRLIPRIFVVVLSRALSSLWTAVFSGRKESLLLRFGAGIWAFF